MESVPPPGGTPQPWERQTPPPPGIEPEPPEQVELSHRLLQAAGVVAVLLIGVIVYSVVAGDEDASIGSTAVAKAAERTWSLPGARFSISGYLTVSTQGDPLPLGGEGEINGRTGRTKETLRAVIPQSPPLHVEAISADGELYVRSQIGELPSGKYWLGVALGLNSSKESPISDAPDARERLQRLQAVSDVDDLGEGTVDGRAAEIYRGKVDPDRYVQLLREEGEEDRLQVYEAVRAAETAKSEKPEDEEFLVWVGGGLVRRIRIDITASTPEGDQRLALQFDFHDFGALPRIEPPTAESIVDMTWLIREKLGLLNGATVRFPHPAEGVRPLTAVGWRANTHPVCARIDSSETRRSKIVKDRVDRLRTVTRDPEGLIRGYAELAAEIFKPSIDEGLKAIEKLAGSVPPPSYQEDFDRYLHLDAIAYELARARVAALEIGGMNRYEALRPKQHALHARIRRIADRIDLGLCEREHNPWKKTAASSA